MLELPEELFPALRDAVLDTVNDFYDRSITDQSLPQELEDLLNWIGEQKPIMKGQTYIGEDDVRFDILDVGDGQVAYWFTDPHGKRFAHGVPLSNFMALLERWSAGLVS